MLSMLKNNLVVAQNQMKQYSDKKRTKRHFEVGDLVYLKLLPPETKIHHVFHVSCLKKPLRPAIIPQSELPQVTDDGLVHNIPQAILAKRMYMKGNVAGVQVLVQWNGQEEASATWKYLDFSL
ncbi:uncharacterized protein [Malus domestica]|uniref:uncharacterized protein n=1 Tax=Malus domestica TaxID=3750 RepID=UPI003974FEAA